MRHLSAALAVLGLLLGARAHAQTSLVTPDGQHFANAIAIWCAQTNGTAIACNFSGGGGGSNAAAGTTGTTAPAAASYTGFLSGSNLVGVSAANPLPITGSISATNPSVAATGSTAPASATELGFISTGNLVGVSAASALPVSVGNFPSSQAVTGTFWQATQPVSGTVADSTLSAVVSGGKVQTNNAAPTGTVSDFGNTSVAATGSTTLVTAASGYRLRAIIYNNTASGGGILSCRADGGTASIGVGVQIYSGSGSYEWDYPAAGTAAINCVCSTGTCTAGGEIDQ